jgi:hypothetical protein
MCGSRLASKQGSVLVVVLGLCVTAVFAQDNPPKPSFVVSSASAMPVTALRYYRLIR